ncbi:PTS sugar transporter subunit IIC [Bombilactobacillus bombi]|uniref:Permease IIC component n=1 Tax=Bombilactobacillus bombi TaxID=1303590 RepID=A0A3R7CLX5_9LACO|nr:PTS transporter subunit EIIC [Bombilactobacillus bombi]RHW48414.1 PTS sugar transporter subunit IIC [Bombilactobacillus bombi]
MNAITKWLNDTLTPFTRKISKNIWIQSIQNAIMMSLPMIFVGSLISVLNLFKNIWKGMPDLTPINTFSFGIFSLFISFLLPYQIMEKKKQSKKKIIAGFSSMGLFLMLIDIKFTSKRATLDFNRLGAGGMLVAIFAGIIVAIIMNFFSKFSFFKEDTSIPEIVTSWFDSMIPISIILFIGYILVYLMKFDFFKLVVDIFNPITNFAQTLPGFLAVCFIPVLIYSFGISSWIVTPVTFTICLGAIAANAAAVAKGQPATNITTFEVIYCGWVFIGGQGGTLPLNIMMLGAKSEKLKAISRATIIPSIFNINEPLVFGTPITWNPMLMIPMWINSLTVPTIVYLTLKNGLVSIPDKLFTMYNLPQPISTWLVCPEVGEIILYVIVFILLSITWYPFYKVYDSQCVKEEQSIN